MTIPLLVMVTSGFVWMFMVAWGSGTGRLEGWLIDVCRILFAVSTLVTLWGLMNRPLW
jgi:hypothetical protein